MPLYLTTRGLTTSPIFADGRAFELELDLIAHELRIETATDEAESFAVEGRSVAKFHDETMRFPLLAC